MVDSFSLTPGSPGGSRTETSQKEFAYALRQVNPAVQVSATVRTIHGLRCLGFWASFITLLTHSCCLPEAYIHRHTHKLPHTQQAVVLPHRALRSHWQPSSPQTQSSFYLLARRWGTLGVNVSCFSGEKIVQKFWNIEISTHEELPEWYMKPHMLTLHFVRQH